MKFGDLEETVPQPRSLGDLQTNHSYLTAYKAGGMMLQVAYQV